jgi:hypothetical protein
VLRSLHEVGGHVFRRQSPSDLTGPQSTAQLLETSGPLASVVAQNSFLRGGLPAIAESPSEFPTSGEARLGL